MPHPHNPANLRAEVDRLLAEGAPDAASRLLAELWRREPGSATASFVTSRVDQLRDKLPLTRFKLAILRSFTVEPIVPLLRAEAFTYGIDLEVHVGDFNTYVQDIVDANSSLYRFAPNAVILAVRTEDVAPDLAREFADLSPEAAQQAAARVARGYEQWIARSASTVRPRSLSTCSNDPLIRASAYSTANPKPANPDSSARSTANCAALPEVTTASTYSITTRWSPAMAASTGTTNANG
jgi:hypothetical protein